MAGDPDSPSSSPCIIHLKTVSSGIIIISKWGLFLRPYREATRNSHLSIKEVSLHQLKPQDFSLDLNPVFQCSPPDISCSHSCIFPYVNPTDTICRTKDVLGPSDLNKSPDSGVKELTGPLKKPVSVLQSLWPFVPILHATEPLRWTAETRAHTLIGKKSSKRCEFCGCCRPWRQNTVWRS